MFCNPRTYKFLRMSAILRDMSAMLGRDDVALLADHGVVGRAFRLARLDDDLSALRAPLPALPHRIFRSRSEMGTRVLSLLSRHRATPTWAARLRAHDVGMVSSCNRRTVSQ